MKRVLALMMCLVMALSLIPAAAAEDIEIVEIETGREDIPEDTGKEELIAIVDPEETLTPPGDELMASKPAITEQPASVKAYVGTTAKFTVSATGATGYQWYYRTSSSGTWSKSSTTGAATATLSVKAETRRSGYQYRCKVSNSAGYVYTEAATLTVTKKPVITQQPESLTIITGGTAKFTVKASGATAYQWYWRANAEDSWHKSTVSTAGKATLVYTNLSSSKSGRQYKCKVSNDAGYVYSSIATLSVSKKPAITQQPESMTIGAGGTAKFTVKADGATAYQWYWRANKDDSWHKSTLSTATASALVCENMAYSKTGRQYKCKVSTAEGYVYSSIATLTVLAKPVITQQPESLTIGAGGTATFTVKADGATAYQWYWRANKDDSWHKSTVSTGAKATLVYTNLSSSKSGRQYKCKVSTAEGYVYSSIATLTVSSEKPTIIVQPLSYEASDMTQVKLTVKALCANSYQWQVREYGTDTWYNSAEEGWNTDTLTVTAWFDTDFYREEYRCVLKNANGTTYSEIARVTAYYDECGDRLSWTLDSNGLLTISGKGEMTDFEEYAAPWQYGGYWIKAISIAEGVTSIGSFAFSDCSKLTSVTIPDSVTSIGSGAFWGCSSLTSITIPNGVTSIGWRAFKDCSRLTSVTIGKGVTSISDDAFAGCSSLTSFTVNSGNTKYSSKNGVLFNKDKTELLRYPAAKSGAYTIPDSVKSIRECAFMSCAGLTSVTIPDSVTSAGGAAFYSCKALKSAEIGKGLSYLPAFQEEIYNYDWEVIDTRQLGFFEGCTGLSEITISDGVTALGDRAFFGCSSLKSVTIPDSVASVGGGVFYGCSALSNVSIGRGVTELPAYMEENEEYDEYDEEYDQYEYYGFFAKCAKLTSVTIGEGMTSIDEYAFSGCTRLSDVYYKGTETQWGKINIDENGNDPLLKATIHYNA